MHYQSLAEICPESYSLSPRERILAAAVLFHLQSIPMQEARQWMADIIQPKLLTLPDRESQRPNILSSTIRGKRLAELLDESIARTAEELENLKAYPDCKTFNQGHLNLRNFSGKRVVQSITPEFCRFLVDCYCVLRW